jgi:hypothetical protein
MRVRIIGGEQEQDIWNEDMWVNSDVSKILDLYTSLSFCCQWFS